MGHPVTHFQLETRDDEATKQFYAQLFGWTITPVPGMPYHSIATGSPQGIQGGIAKVDESQPAAITFYVEVPDVAAALAQAQSLGATVTQAAVQVMPDLTLGMFKDPEGRSVGLSHSTLVLPVATPKAASAPAKPKAKASKKAKPAKKAKPIKKAKKKKK